MLLVQNVSPQLPVSSTVLVIIVNLIQISYLGRGSLCLEYSSKSLDCRQVCNTFY